MSNEIIERPVIDTSSGLAKEVTTITRAMDKWRALPSTRDAITALRKDVKDSTPIDTPISFRELTMYNTGHVGGKNRCLPLTRNALGDVLGFMDCAGDLKTLEKLSPGARAIGFNDLKTGWLAQSGHAALADKQLIARTLKLPGQDGQVIRAFVSEKHSIDTGDDLVIADALERAFGPQLDTSKLRIVRTFERTDLELLFPQVGNGRDTFAKLRITNSEVRKTSFESFFGLFRLICANGMSQELEGSGHRIRHVGDISYKVRNSLIASFTGGDQFMSAWSTVQGLPLPAPRGEVIEGVSRELKKELPESLFGKLDTLWDVDGAASAGHTVAGLVNAMTRAAQSYDYATADRIELAAGRITSDSARAGKLVL